MPVLRILDQLATQLGGDPMYVSPAACMDEFLNAKLMEPVPLAGSVDPFTLELTCLDAVVLAETRCHANWQFLQTLAQQMPASAVQQALQAAVEEAGPQEDEHIAWAKSVWQQALMRQRLPI